MNWQEICEHPALRELPFKIETNQWGKIEMCPASLEFSELIKTFPNYLELNFA